MQRAILLHQFITLLFVTMSLVSKSQSDSLPSNRFVQANEFEKIILDGDTVLRSKWTNKIISKHIGNTFEANHVSFKTDWMNYNWDTKVFNPYKNSESPKWPVQITFKNEKFVMPIEGLVTSRFGWRKGRAHKGIDLDLVTGDNVVAAMDGKVRFAKYYSGFGNVVVIRHNNGLETVYAHLSKILTQPNTLVRSGQVIGKGGNTGRSYGSHLHFEVLYLGHAINPEYFFDFTYTKYLRSQDYLVDALWADPRKHRSYKMSQIVVKKPNLETFVPATMLVNEESSSTFEHHIESASTTSSQSLDEPKSTNTFEQQNATKEFYKVKKGDTLARIAKQYNTSVLELTKLNNISKSSIIHIGQKLRVK